MIELCKLEGKKVRLVDNEGKVWIGTVGDYCWEDDEDPESIILDTDQAPFPEEFDHTRIRSIEIIE